MAMTKTRTKKEYAIDIFIATAVPLAVHGITLGLSSIRPQVWDLVKDVRPRRKTFFRTIEFEKVRVMKASIGVYL